MRLDNGEGERGVGRIVKAIRKDVNNQNVYNTL